MYYNSDEKQARSPQKPDDYWQAGFNADNSDDELHLSGLRGRRLCIVLSCLGLLFLLALTTLLCNIGLLLFLGMGHRGMNSLQFHRVNQGDSQSAEHVLEFTSKQVELDELVSNNGSLGGYKNEQLFVQGSRMVIGSEHQGKGAHPTHVTQLILEDQRIRVEGVHDLEVLSNAGGATGRTLFSAKNPKFKMDKSIKQLTAKQIMTNQVRSPVDKSLRFEVENLSFRGNEFNKFNSRSLSLVAENNILVHVNSNGRLLLSAERVLLGAYANYSLSSSPSLSADLLARRLCACLNTHRLFVVPGNTACNIDPGYCY